ncbi:MAG TPA: alanine racemase [Verrucomicrobiae bacterium]|nr:alanine racemase [Verrucomicrobiae bacterium]
MVELKNATSGAVSAGAILDQAEGGNLLLQPLTAPAPTELPRRPAWVEINLSALKRNFQLINRDKPASLKVLSVVKDDGYGHGAGAVGRAALDCGASFLALSTVDEAMALRDQGFKCRLLLLGDRHESELPWCVAHDLTCCVSDLHAVERLVQLAERLGRRIPVHLKINTGMNRYGVRWTSAAAFAEHICASKALYLEGVLTHFAQSDEADKTYANLQLSRFNEALDQMHQRGVNVGCRHLCNSGGFLDLPHAHFEMVRLGILPLGVFPSTVCRRIASLQPVMSVKARIAAIQTLEPGDCVGYGMRYTAPSRRRIAVLPLGYGDGFPRVRNQGSVLVHGHRAPLVGGVAMDAITVDITDIPAAALWDEAVIMGRQGQDEISVHEVAKLKGSVSYDVLTSWRSRLPRVYVS